MLKDSGGTAPTSFRCYSQKISRIRISPDGGLSRESHQMCIGSPGIYFALLFSVKQLVLIQEKKYPARKTARPISLRGANHVILKSGRPVLRRHARAIRWFIRQTQDRYEMKLRALAIMPDHVHLVIRKRSSDMSPEIQSRRGCGGWRTHL